MKIKVVYSVWGADGFDEPLHGGEHELEGVTEAQARSIFAAEASGAVEVLDATDAERKLADGHVQSQEDGEAAQLAAMGTWVEDVWEGRPDGERTLLKPGRWSGGWHEGNLQHFIVGKKERLAYDDWLKTTPGAAEKAQADYDRAVDLGDHVPAWPPLTDAERGLIEHQLDQAEAALRDSSGVPADAAKGATT